MPASGVARQPTHHKYRDLCALLRRHRRVAVAFSGGVDSSLLLAAALNVHGGEVLVLHARTPLQAAGEYERAMQVAAGLDCRPQVVPFDPYAWPEFVTNPADRCYHCKKRLYSHFKNLAADRGGAVLLDGTNADDRNSDRPGLRALVELEVQAPLAESGLDKAEIRHLAREMELPNWNKPAASCLATRIMAGQPITGERIGLVAAGEQYLAELGFGGCRFRHQGEQCLVEVTADDLPRLNQQDIWSKVHSFCNKLGFVQVKKGLRP